MNARQDYMDRPHFLYSVLDADGVIIYVGVALNVAARLLQHHKSLGGPTRGTITKPATWLLDARSLDVTGPYDRRTALNREKALIARVQPRGNTQWTARDPRPATARRSAEIALEFAGGAA